MKKVRCKISGEVTVGEENYTDESNWITNGFHYNVVKEFQVGDKHVYRLVNNQGNHTDHYAFRFETINENKGNPNLGVRRKYLKTKKS